LQRDNGRQKRQRCQLYHHSHSHCIRNTRAAVWRAV